MPSIQRSHRVAPGAGITPRGHLARSRIGFP
jgi:hypothetical protein